eukprot:gb/GFBE01058108.1/.p1 GENE.gb/GFBE01058108.1/~~gb/GFBE01058108.1/.p1  ORF type:complete len:169 (+),score=37.95 gb/GFBE01058108.1/:1-507(+)
MEAIHAQLKLAAELAWAQTEARKLADASRTIDGPCYIDVKDCLSRQTTYGSGSLTPLDEDEGTFSDDVASWSEPQKLVARMALNVLADEEVFPVSTPAYVKPLSARPVQHPAPPGLESVAGLTDMDRKEPPQEHLEDRPVMKKFCQQCGAKRVSDIGIFCTSCGTKLA